MTTSDFDPILAISGLSSLIVGLIGVLLRAGENSRRRNTLSRTTSAKVSKP
jgi:hypothetical protein